MQWQGSEEPGQQRMLLSASVILLLHLGEPGSGSLAQVGTQAGDKGGSLDFRVIVLERESLKYLLDSL